MSDSQQAVVTLTPAKKPRITAEKPAFRTVARGLLYAQYTDA